MTTRIVGGDSGGGVVLVASRDATSDAYEIRLYDSDTNTYAATLIDARVMQQPGALTVLHEINGMLEAIHRRANNLPPEIGDTVRVKRNGYVGRVMVKDKREGEENPVLVIQGMEDTARWADCEYT